MSLKSCISATITSRSYSIDYENERRNWTTRRGLQGKTLYWVQLLGLSTSTCTLQRKRLEFWFSATITTRSNSIDYENERRNRTTKSGLQGEIRLVGSTQREVSCNTSMCPALQRKRLEFWFSATITTRPNSIDYENERRNRTTKSGQNGFNVREVSNTLRHR